jgi:HYR domain-containing protein
VRRRSLLVLAAVAALTAIIVAVAAGADPPTINVPPDRTVEATSAAGAVVTYSVTAVNNGGNDVDVECAPPSGSTFPIGHTVVTCTVTDSSTGTVESEASFNVDVVDTTPPTLSLPAGIDVAAGSSDGMTVDYTATASDVVDGDVQPSCSPASGSQFPVGDTTVSCTATDAHANTSSGSFTVTVEGPPPPPPPPGDTTPPVITVPATLKVEATGPSGAAVDYTATATDGHDGPVAVSCSPPPQSTFPLGNDEVDCSAVDAAGNKATASFTVSVVDVSPPILAVPGATTVQATSADGVAASAPAVAAFLSSPVAQDLVDPSPVITNNAPATFPIGDTTVTFTAKDASGNATTKVSKLTVLAPASAPTPTPAPAPSPAPAPPPTTTTTTTPTPPGSFRPPTIPPNASTFTAKAGRGTITLQWSLPASSSVDHVELLRAQASLGVQTTVVYRGSARSFVDRKVQDGQSYRYQLVSVGSAGDRSSGVALTAFPLPLRLLAPLSGAKLHAAPQLRWLPTAGAAYYNVQLYRNGTKVLSIWPVSSKLQLVKAWKYLGHTYTLAPGSYRWYVWAGFGARSARKYSPLLGQAIFIVAP